MNITIHGSGYVGLVAGACFAHTGHHVVCMDIDKDKIAALKEGKIPFYEPGLESIVNECLGTGHLQFTSEVGAAVAHGDLQFIAVATPANADGCSDLQQVRTVTESIARCMNSPKIIVTKSTVPVGTAELMRQIAQNNLSARGLDLEVSVVSNPEFLKEGNALNDFMKPDRIIIGVDDEKTRSIMQKLYAPFNRNHDRMLFMDARSAELSKYAANAMLAAKISFMNELAGIAEQLGVDIEQVRQGIGSDPRIGYQFIYAGCGFGGSCLPKDIQALQQMAAQHDLPCDLLQAVEKVNLRQKSRLFELIARHYQNNLKDKVIAVWGLAFKPKTSDVREAPSRALLEALWRAGASVRAYDPQAMPEIRRIYADQPGLTLAESQEMALTGANALVICTEWQGFQVPDFDFMGACLKDKAVFDGRNLYEPALMKEKGFAYYGIGRGESLKAPLNGSPAK